MKIAVFGATGATGRLLTEQALAAGHDVTAVTRRPAAFPITHERLSVVEADVHDEQAVDRAVNGADAVLSTLGVPFARNPIAVDWFVHEPVPVTTSDSAPALFQMLRREVFKAA